MRLLALVLVGIGLAAAAEPVPAEVPGRLPPASPAAATAYVFTWDDYRSVAVIGEGVGTHRPGWVVTWAARPLKEHLGPVEQLPALGAALPERWPRHLVAYRVLAYRDGRGRVHLDARGALLAGPMAQDWSPDSFMIAPDGRVDTVDDDPTHTTHQGAVEVDAPLGTPRYQALRQQVELVVGGGI